MFCFLLLCFSEERIEGFTFSLLRFFLNLIAFHWYTIQSLFYWETIKSQWLRPPPSSRPIKIPCSNLFCSRHWRQMAPTIWNGVLTLEHTWVPRNLTTLWLPQHRNTYRRQPNVGHYFFSEGTWILHFGNNTFRWTTSVSYGNIWKRVSTTRRRSSFHKHLIHLRVMDFPNFIAFNTELHWITV